MKIVSAVLVCFVALLTMQSCAPKGEKESLIMVTIEPQRYFAEKIAGDKYKIECVVPAGQSPETYDPTPRQMVQIGKSVAYLEIGFIGFEQAWMHKIKENNPDLLFFDTSKGMKFITGPEAACTHHHGDDAHTHAHEGGVDPHIWTCIEGAKVIAWNTLNALIQLDKENASYYWDNYNRLFSEIEVTEATLEELLAPLAGTAFIIYHPALTYFADEFQLHQLCIEMEGKEPSPAQLKMLVDTAKNEQVKVVFIQQEFDKKNAELIAKETGCRLVVINPLDYDWHKEMIHIAKALADGKAN